AGIFACVTAPNDEQSEAAHRDPESHASRRADPGRRQAGARPPCHRWIDVRTGTEKSIRVLTNPRFAGSCRRSVVVAPAHLKSVAGAFAKLGFVPVAGRPQVVEFAL